METTKSKLTNRVVIQIAHETGADPKTVRRAFQRKPGKGETRRRVDAALRAAGLLAALLLFQGCAEADVAQQLAPGAGGNVSPSSRSTGTVAGAGGFTWSTAGTGGQVGAGGASTIPGTGGSREDAKAPAGPEAGGDGGQDERGAEVGSAGAEGATDVGGADALATEAGHDLSAKEELFTIPCGSNYGETSMCPPPQMCAPSRYCQYTCTLGSTAPNQGCPDGLTCRISSLRWDFCS